MGRARLLGLFICSLAASGVGAEPPDAASELDETPVFYATATVRERAVEASSSSVTVVDREVIEASGAVNASEPLAFVPGVTLISATRGGLSTAQIRGGDPNFTRLLIDGVPVNDGTYQVGGVFNLEALPADAVERIEVVRGPLSSIYGSTGLSGAVHVITRRGDGAPHGAVELTGGDADLRRVGLSFGTGDDDGDVFVHLLDEGERRRIADEGYDLRSLQGRLGKSFSEDHSLRLAVRGVSWQGDDYPDASGGPVYGSGELRQADNDELGLSLSWARGDTTGRLLRLDGSWYRHDLDRTSPAVFPLVPSSSEETSLSRARLGVAADLPLSQGSWSFGFDVELEDANNRSLLHLPPFLGGDVAGDYSVERTTPGVYTEWIRHTGSVTVELGLRVDAPEQGSEEASPRLGLAYELNSSTRFTLSAGRAFKLPSFFALVSPRPLGGNPDLRPETVVGGDLGIEHRCLGGRAQVGFKVFVQRFEDLVDFDFETFLHVNRAEVDAEGVESFLAWDANETWSVAANLTYQEVEDASTGLPLRHRPEWSGALRWTGRDLRGFDVHADLRILSSRVDQQIPVPDLRRVAGYELLGLAVARDFGPWQVSLRFDNLTDASFENQIGFPGAGRSGRLSVRRHFGG